MEFRSKSRVARGSGGVPGSVVGGRATGRGSGGGGGNRSPNSRDRGGIMGDSEGDAAGKFFIGGVSWQTTEAGLREHFGKFGELQDVALMRNKHTGQPRGFGFVKFKDNSGACVVLSLFWRFVRWRPWTPFQI